MMQLRKDFEFAFRMLLCLLVAFIVVDSFAGDYLYVSELADSASMAAFGNGLIENRLIRYSLHFDHSRT